MKCRLFSEGFLSPDLVPKPTVLFTHLHRRFHMHTKSLKIAKDVTRVQFRITNRKKTLPDYEPSCLHTTHENRAVLKCLFWLSMETII